jgi:hypothetical protein
MGVNALSPKYTKNQLDLTNLDTTSANELWIWTVNNCPDCGPKVALLLDGQKPIFTRCVREGCKWRHKLKPASPKPRRWNKPTRDSRLPEVGKP